jgi:poly(3-hydroxybutyrate) depolymerase
MRMLLPILLITAQFASAKVSTKMTEIDGTRVYYTVILPTDYDPEKAYPAILAFPPGSQDQAMVQFTVQQNWAAQAQKRGYIVVVPQAPLGESFAARGARVFPKLIEQILADYKIRDGKFHIAGLSNGGMSAFNIAASHPQYFTSITGFPGYLRDATPERVNAISKMCINMHVGELDSENWVENVQKQAADFKARGLNVKFTLEKGQPHVINTLSGPGAARLFDQIERGCL